MTTTRAGRWRRRLTRAALVGGCLLLGAATTVGVAWGCVCRSEPLSTQRRQDAPWPGPVPTAWGAACWRLDTRSFGVVESQCASVAMLPVPTSDYHLAETPVYQACLRAGWPNSCLATHRSVEGSPFTINYARAPSWYDIVPTARWQDGLAVPKWLRASANNRVLPTIPISSGFLLNTLFYALPWWALLATPGLVKRWRRKRHGGCVVCGYDLRGLPGGTGLRTVTEDNGSGGDIKGEGEDTARRAVPPKCPECGT